MEGNLIRRRVGPKKRWPSDYVLLGSLSKLFVGYNDVITIQ